MENTNNANNGNITINGAVTVNVTTPAPIDRTGEVLISNDTTFNELLSILGRNPEVLKNAEAEEARKAAEREAEKKRKEREAEQREGERKEGRREGRREGGKEGESGEGSRPRALVTSELCSSVR